MDINKYKKKPEGIIKTVISEFLVNHRVIINSQTVIHVPIEEIHAYRLMTRTRENSRPGGVHDEYNSRAKEWFKENHPGQYYEGQEKWDLLVDKMKLEGWKDDNPAVIMVRREKKCRLWDGHHRVFVARELGIKSIPVRFACRMNEL